MTNKRLPINTKFGTKIFLQIGNFIQIGDILEYTERLPNFWFVSNLDIPKFSSFINSLGLHYLSEKVIK